MSLAAIKEFARWVIQEACWEGCDLDGGLVQDKAASLGLITSTIYDPQKHGPSDICEAGDAWFVFAPIMKAPGE